MSYVYSWSVVLLPFIPLMKNSIYNMMVFVNSILFGWLVWLVW